MPGQERIIVMPDVKWTEEQLQVIGSKGQNLLVSAAAGSGKTAVLVERILRRILDPEHPADIDRMLIVTFTNAAAAQLREKVRGALLEVLREKPGDPAALRQLSLLAGDHIETIDSFCREVVLDHYAKVGADPSFRVADEGEIKLLRSEAAAEAAEEAYAEEEPERAADFRDLVQCYVTGTSDRALEDLIIRFFLFSESHAFPKIWRASCAALYEEDPDDSAWMESFREDLEICLRDLQQEAEYLLALCGGAGGPDGYSAALADDEAFLSSLMKAAGDPGAIHALLDAHDWVRLGRHTDKAAVDPEKEKRVNSGRKKIKDEITKLKERLFPLSEEETERCRLMTGRYMRALVHLTDRFEEIFSRMKAQRGIVDFSDVAHLALRILIRTDESGVPVRDESGHLLPTDTAALYRDWFEEVCIDEYQDSNPVQELLLWSVSRESGEERAYNRFMVGDVKQSIYRFRMAEPDIFIQKGRSYGRDAGDVRRRIDLHRNFRSRACIIDGVNAVFERIMRREAGGVEYDASERLAAGAPFPEWPDPEKDAAASAPELLLVGREEVPDAANAVEAEAEAIAARIRSLVGEYRIVDPETGAYRPASWKDIVILLRVSGRRMETLSRVLTSHGIPNRSGTNTGYFDAPEVRTILAYLNVLDNPRQDIPLAAALCSDIGRMDERELAAVRAFAPELSLYDCVQTYRKEGADAALRGKLERFVQMTQRLRARVCDTPIHLLLWQIFDETGYADAAAAAPGGRQKKANLDLLTDKAIAYEETSYRGLFHFVRYIEKLRKGEQDFGEAGAPGDGGDYVRIMTMHASKGLEFPIVFVSGLEKQFNLQDSAGTLVLHARLGAGLDYVDPGTRVRTANRIKGAISRAVRSDSIGEELRVLYVAMTRAKEKLILSWCAKDREAYLEKVCSGRKEERLTVSGILGAHCAADWVAAALIEAGEEGQAIVREPFRLLSGADVHLAREARKVKEASCALRIAQTDPDQVYSRNLNARLRAMLDHFYPFARSRGIPGKISVSELKHETYEAEMERRAMREEAASLREILPRDEAASPREILPVGNAVSPGFSDDIPIPSFLKEGEGDAMAGAAKGTAYHLVLASMDFTGDSAPGQIPALLESMVNCDKIQRADAEGLDIGKIEHFLQTELAGRMRAAAARGQLFREQPFVIGKDSGEIRPEWESGETVLIQGIIDAFFLEGDHIILIDYKSDYARPGDEDSLVARYRTQFALYRDALEALLPGKVTESWLYSLSLGKAIEVCTKTKDAED